MAAFHDSPEPGSTTVWTSSECSGLWRALGGSIGIGKNLPGAGVDTVFLHPAPILLVQLRPFCTELQPAIPRLDIIDAFGGLGYARCGADVRSSTGGVPPPRSSGKYSALALRCTDATGSHFFACHEREQSDQNRRDLPGGIEGLGVEVADAETEAGGWLEATTGGVHPDGRRGKRVLGREDQGAPILAILIWGPRRSS